MTTPTKPPDWLNLYIERYKKGEITIEGILKEENERRASKGINPLKHLSVKRALNMAGLSIRKKEKEKHVEETKVASKGKIRAKGRGRGRGKGKIKEKEVKPKTTIEKPCKDCKHYKVGVCIYPESLFKHYRTLDDFGRDILEGKCKLKLH